MVSGAVPLREASASGAGSIISTGPRPISIVPTFAFLVLLNVVAMYGQTMWLHENARIIIPAAVGVAGVIELIGVFLSAMAHAARMAKQSAVLLRIASYSIGLTMGALNYGHWSQITFSAGITFGIISAISPWLWSVYTTYRYRAQLTAMGEVDTPMVTLSLGRWLLHPRRSFSVLRFATWEGITRPDEAVRAWELTRVRADAPVSPAPAPARTAAEWVALADEMKAENPKLGWGKVASIIGCSDSHLRACRRQARAA